MNMPPLALVRLLRLSSPALPVGAYAYSQGMESAVDAGWVHDRDSAAAWISGVMRHQLACLDLPLLLRLCLACSDNDVARFHYWNRYLLACRESAELHFEDTQMGAALWKIIVSSGLGQSDYKAVPLQSFASSFAFVGVRWNIPVPWLMTGFCWSWLENQVAAATKLVPLGQTAAQQVFDSLHETVMACVEKASGVNDDDIGASLPAFTHLCACHEIQYTRLFRS